LDERGRNELVKFAAAGLKIDYDEIRKQRLFELVTPNEVRKLSRGGMDVQLHTHRHRMPDDEGEIRYEIEQNRNFLSAIISEPRDHFCYPSGVFSNDRLPVLAALGIKTATTCESGLNTSHTHPLLLHRFLDHMEISDIEFEAELTGFKEFARMLLGFARNIRHRYA
jgi:peptidoglycan/xylan/chitin deacetylase (PgdA/CDA1 family)